MKRLVDGVYAIIEEAPEDSELERLDEGAIFSLSSSDAAELSRLAHGVADDEPDTPLFARLREGGLAGEGLSAVDPVVEARLEELGRGLAWTLARHDEGPALASRLRRGHARRKVFVQAFGQTPCLPESAANRCLELTRHKPPGARVLLLGDDDLLCLGLAHLGYEVTSVDIDPLLVSFVARVAQEEGLDIDARVLDLLAPLGDDDVGAFDAVLTDPMSFHDCMLAFVTRALTLCKDDGVVLSCVHPVARSTFRAVLPRLPASVAAVRTLLSAYYFDRYIENAYRSDLVVLQRQAGPLHFQPDEQIPFEAITEGRLSEHEHALVSAKGMRSKSKPPPTPDELSRALTSSLDRAVADSGGASDERFVHAWAALSGGGHLAATFDTLRTSLELSMTPGDRNEVEEALSAQRVMRVMRQKGWFVSAFHAPPGLL
jgi:hypothetical protein